MDTPAWILLAAYLAVLLLSAWPLGKWLTAVAEGRLPRWFAPLATAERALYRMAGVEPSNGMDWRRYALALILFNFLGVLAVYALQRLQGVLPLESGRHGRSRPRFGLQHRGQLRHQHQLARLRRRIDDELPDADAGADGSELPLRRHRNRRRHCAGPRLRGPFCRLDRQLLGRHHAHHRLCTAAAVAAVGMRAGEPGRDSEPVALPAGDDARHHHLLAAEERPRWPTLEGRRRVARCWTRSRQTSRRWRWARWHRRRPSRCSAPTAVASSTPTRRTPTRTRHR